MTDYEQREGLAFAHYRAKYTQKDRDKMAASGQAMSDGSYPIADKDDLTKAIHAVGRGGADHDSIRKHVMARAKALKLSDLIPDNWNADGSLKDTKGVWTTLEQRETHNDLWTGLSDAIGMLAGEDGWGYYAWVQDFDDERVIYSQGGQLYSAPYTVEPEGPITIGAPTPVRPITDYVIAGRSIGGHREHRAGHGAYTGSHTHSHSAMGDQGDDETHDHDHSHDGDADHDHSHSRGAPALIGRAPTLSDEARASLLTIRGELAGTREFRDYPFQDYEVRVASGPSGERTFTGYASVFGSGYTISDFLGDFTETVNRAAFDRTIAERCDTAFLVNHGGLTMARTKPGTLLLSPDSRGLHVEATLDPRRTDVGDLCLAIEAKAIDEMSFAFRCIRDNWSPDWDERELLEVSLHHGDVCPVNFGANSATAGLVSMRSLRSHHGLTLVGVPAMTGLFREVRAGAALSSTAVATLKHVLSLAATADTSVDELQSVLSEFLGVPNPDTDETNGAGMAPERRQTENGCACCPTCSVSCEGDCCPDCQGVPQQSAADIAAAMDATSNPDSAATQTLADADRDREERLRLIELGAL